MTSRELLVLLDGLPERSEFKTWAFRGGDWSQEQHVQARIANQLALSRADGRDYEPDLILSPYEMAREQEHDHWQISRHDEVLAQLRGEK